MNNEIKFKRESAGRYLASTGNLDYLIYKLDADQRSPLENWSLIITDDTKDAEGFVVLQDWWNTKADIIWFLKYGDQWFLTENGYLTC